jgi:predicted esterase YcpF (UPF0227 family)
VIVYIHGFNSSPRSHKARLLQERLGQLQRGEEFACPALSHRPAAAMADLRRIVAGSPTPVTLVGSSLGGFYATHLAETIAVRAILVNPAITPHEGLRAYLGPQRNLYTDEPYELTEQHLAELASLYVPRLTQPDRYLLMVTTGDEVLDYREAVARYDGSRQLIVHGSDHGFADFGEYLDTALDFCDDASPAGESASLI